jgi:pimeloyl-ACP methyl ester carboxylesterase
MSHVIPLLPETKFLRILPVAQPRYLGDRFSLREAGPLDAPPVVLLHGIGAHAAYFRWTLQALAPQRRVIAWNAPGYWLSDNLITRTPTAADYAQAVADFLDALGLERVVLYGHSFGSAVAQAFAIAHPQRVSHLVLSGTGVGQQQLSEQRRQAFEARAQRVRLGSYQYGDAGVDAMVGAATPAPVRELLVEMARGIHPEGLLRAVSFRLSDFYSPEHAAALTMPTLMLQGSEDRINPRQENCDLLLPHLAQGRLEVLPGVGHMPEVEVPEVVERLVRQFLSS